jgi:uroporphyrinogen-III synthase
MPTQLLKGKRILVTRAAGQAGKLSDGLRELGAEPVELPLIEIQPPASYRPLDNTLKQLEFFDCLILTSTNAVSAVVQRAAHLGIAASALSEIPVAAVGKATADFARKNKLKVTFQPARYVGEALVAELRSIAPGKRFLLARSSVARDVIPDQLRAIGATVEVVDAYQNVPPSGAAEQMSRALNSKLNAATFSSSSTVHNFVKVAELAGFRTPPAGLAAISIGPITSATLREYAWEPAAEASPSDIPGLIQAVVRSFGK